MHRSSFGALWFFLDGTLGVRVSSCIESLSRLAGAAQSGLGEGPEAELAQERGSPLLTRQKVLRARSTEVAGHRMACAAEICVSTCTHACTTVHGARVCVWPVHFQVSY